MAYKEKMLKAIEVNDTRELEGLIEEAGMKCDFLAFQDLLKDDVKEPIELMSHWWATSA